MIRSTAAHPEYLPSLRARLELEWGSIDPFSGTDVSVTIPPPLILLTEDHQLVGGLSFSTYENPNKSEIGVWINALLIEPGQRRRGYGSRLIQAAEAEAVKIRIPELFVLTEFPGLYKKIGWNRIRVAGSDTLLGKSLG